MLQGAKNLKRGWWVARYLLQSVVCAKAYARQQSLPLARQVALGGRRDPGIAHAPRGVRESAPVPPCGGPTVPWVSGPRTPEPQAPWAQTA